MPAKIDIMSSDVWGYFQDCKAELKTHMHQIAGNPDYGIEIFVTEDVGLPNIVVIADDVQIYEETAVSEKDCQKTVSKIYDEYLTDKILEKLSSDDEDMSEFDVEDMIAEREDELDNAVYDFVMSVMQETYFDQSPSNFDNMLEDFKEHFLEYMARKYNLPIYRPMILVYDDGTEDVSEYPYEEIVFDDADNPIYMS